MMGFIQIFVASFLLWQNIEGQLIDEYGQIGSGGPISNDGRVGQLPVIVLDGQRGGQASGQRRGGQSFDQNAGVVLDGQRPSGQSFGQNAGVVLDGQRPGGQSFGQNAGIVLDGQRPGGQSFGQNVGTGSQFGPSPVRPIGQNAAFGPVNIGQDGLAASRFAFGQGGVLTNRLFGQSSGPLGQGGARASGQLGSGQGVSRVVQAPVTPTVTKTVTIDRFVTLTDLAYHSIPVTLTDLVVRTTTVTSRQVIQTPTDDLVALQTSVVTRPTSVTVTATKFDYRIATEVSVAHVTVTHNYYIIRQLTYTTTATQLSTFPATMVRTIVRTQRTTVTDYRTITNVVHGYGNY